MKFKNTTDIPDAFLRKMVTWVAKECEITKSAIKSISFENRTQYAYSGRCWRSGKVVCGIGGDEFFPHKYSRDRDDYVEADRIEGLIYITAHELFHIYQFRNGKIGGYQRIEKAARNAGYQAVFAFRKNREALLAHWSKERQAPARPKLSVKERNYAAALEKLKAWERKAKLAQTKLKMYRAKVRKYEREGLAACGSK